MTDKIEGEHGAAGDGENTAAAYSMLLPQEVECEYCGYLISTHKTWSQVQGANKTFTSDMVCPKCGYKTVLETVLD